MFSIYSSIVLYMHILYLEQNYLNSSSCSPSSTHLHTFLNNSLDTINASCMVMGVEGIYQGPAQQKNDAPTAFNCQ